MNDSNKSEDLWTPYKTLQRVILKQLSGKQPCTSEFETTLRKHRQTFFSLLQNPKKSAKSREELKKGMQDGITLKKLGHQVLSKELYQEAIILSDMYDMNEHVALDLLCTAQTQKPHHPGLPRGLVAVVLYYDGRKAIVNSLRLLVQARAGIQWSVDIAPDVEKFITLYTNHLMEGGFFNRIFELLNSLDLSKELEKLQQNLALGGPRHRRQVIQTFNEIRHILADIIFLWASQSGLPKDVTLNLLGHLRQVNLEEEATGKIDDVNMLLQMAFLAAVDLSILHTREDGEEAVQNLPIMSDPNYISGIVDHFAPNVGEWKCTGLHALSRFGLAVCIASLRLLPENKRTSGIISTEHIFDVVINMKLFEFLHNVFLENNLIYKERFICKRLHYLFTDFIVYMYPKVKELRIRADDDSRTMQNYAREGLEAPTQVSKPFEYLLLTLAKFYSKNEIEREFVLEYWSPVEINPNQSYSYQASPRAVSLFKFIRLVGDMVPKNLFVPFVNMLSSLASCQQAARHCFNLLKLGTQVSLTLSWDHFFTSFSQYYSFLRQEAPVGDTIYRQRSMYQKGVQPHEIEGLQAVLLLITTVAKHDEFSRLALCEHPGWAPLTVLLGLVGCAVPPALKADLLLTLAALSKSSENSSQMWENIESSQILVTVPTTSSYQSRGLQTELEEVESRMEEYPLTRAFLTLLDTLTDIGIPRTLGAGPRKPGFDPYLHYIVNCVFVKYHTRAYKNPMEKWMVANLCLKLFEKFLVQYSPQVNDFQANNEFNSPPGYHIMVQLSNRTLMLEVILDIINQGVEHFDTNIFYPTHELIVECILRSLSIIQKVLTHQQKFFALMASLPSQTVIFSTITKILLHDINPKSGRPDHTLNIARYIIHQSSYPSHALLSVKILNDLTSLPKNHSSIVSNLLCSDDINQVIKYGFTECLDLSDDDSELIVELKMEILKLLKQCLPYSSPNLSHFLLGFNVKQDISKTEFQLAGVSEFPKSCLHSIITLMQSAVVEELTTPRSQLLESAFNLLYLLASNSLTSGPVLRFLRMKPNFFQEHLSLAVKYMNKGLHEFNQVTWIIKTLAVELKVSNATKQLSYMKQLTNFLIDMPKLLILKKDSYNVIHKQGISSSDMTNQDAFNRKVAGGETVFTPADDFESDNFLIRLIYHFELKIQCVEMPYWEFFDKEVLTNTLNKCQGYGKPKLIDLKRLHQVLYDELKNLQGTAVLGQIQAISQEIPKVLKYALEVNKFRETASSVVKFTDAWRQIVEVLAIYVPPEVLTPREQQLFSLQVAENILRKISKGLLLPEVYIHLSGAVLILLDNLRKTYIHEKKQQKVLKQDFHRPSDVLQLHQNYLRNILSNLIEWIMVSDIAIDKLRANQYSSLIILLQLINFEDKHDDVSVDDSMYVTRLDSSRYSSQEQDTKIHIAMDVLSAFGEKLIENICQDCIGGGHMVCRVLAMASIGSFISVTSNQNWIVFISGRGYLKHIIQSLLDEEDDLVSVIQPNPQNLKPLYLYLAKISFLCRLANVRVGAELLLEQRVLSCFSIMKVFSRHPEILKVWNKDDTLDNMTNSVEHKYLQLFLPTFDLCNAILTTLGTDNRSAVIQIMYYLLSHLDVIELILRSGSSTLSPLSLKELSLVTSVISRTANNDLIDVLHNPEIHQNYRSQLYRIQKLMLALLPRFILSDNIVRDLISSSVDDENTFQTSERLLYAMQVMSNILCYARNTVANHGIDHSGVGVIFQPTLHDPLLNLANKHSFSYSEETPSLGGVIQQLLCTVNYYHQEKVTFDLLNRKMREIPEMNSIDLREFMSESKTLYDLPSIRKHVYEFVSEKLQKKKQELEYSAYIIENCLYLVWTHLDYYMLKAIPKGKPFGPTNLNLSITVDQTLASASEATWKISTDDISNLKQGLVSVFNDSFCKRLLETVQDRSESDKGLLEALLRKIKRLIQFVPVK